MGDACEEGGPRSRTVTSAGGLARHRRQNVARERSLTMSTSFRFRRGRRVYVRAADEILATLARDGTFEGLPFMPEMLRHCGQRFAVSHLMTKTCVEGHGLRQMDGTVSLEGLGCDGACHEGCERRCLLFWKEAWLSEQPPRRRAPAAGAASASGLETRRGEQFVCQSTELLRATAPLPAAKLFVYLRDVRLGEMSVEQFARQAASGVSSRGRRLLGLYRDSQPRGCQRVTMEESLGLRPGDWVEVKSQEEIESTLNTEGKNRGLLFSATMLPYCGRRYRVAERLEKIIREDTGRMVELRNTVILEGVVCAPPTCPRANLLYWREVWLRRLAAPDAAQDAEAGRASPLPSAQGACAARVVEVPR